MIFRLRGIEREELLSLVGRNTAAKGKTRRTVNAARASVDEQESVSVQTPPPSEPEVFWGKIDIKSDFLGETTVPSTPAALPKQLGNFPFWRGEERFLDILVPIYSEASLTGLEIVVGVFGSADQQEA